MQPPVPGQEERLRVRQRLQVAGSGVGQRPGSWGEDLWELGRGSVRAGDRVCGSWGEGLWELGTGSMGA